MPTRYFPSISQREAAITQMSEYLSLGSTHSGEFWAALLSSLATLIIAALWSRFRRSSLWFDLFSARRIAAGLATYSSAELAVLASWPSVISTKVIDHSIDYVELILVEQRRSSVLHSKRTVTIQEILSSDTPTAIVSGPGCGKTALLLRTHYQLLHAIERRRTRLTPRSVSFFVRARDLVPPNDTIREHLFAKVSEYMEKRSAEWLIQVGLKRGWFVILVDGLDEIADDVCLVLGELRRFAELFPACPLIVSSRPISYDLSSLSGCGKRPFKEVAIAPLTLGVKKLLVQRYADTRTAERILELLVQQPFLSELTNVTINLLLLINSVSYSESIERKSDFYRQAVRVLLATVPERKGIALNYSVAEKEAVLASLCFQVLIHGKAFVKDLVWSNKVKLNSAAFIEIQESSGLLRLVASDRYDFPHRTFAEYFAAMYIVENYARLSDDDWQKILQNRAAEVIGFICNLLESPGNLVSRIFACRSAQPLLLAIALAECRSLEEATQEAAETVIWNHLSTATDVLVPSSQTRLILSRIHQFPRARSFRTIYLKLLDSLINPVVGVSSKFASREEVQTYALRFLIHTSSREIVPHLVSIFRSPDSDTYVRFKAGELLTELADEGLLQDLRKSYFENDDVDVRRFVVEAIVGTRSPAAVAILECARKDEDLVIRDLAAEGIKYITDKSFLEDAAIVRLCDVPGAVNRIVPGCDIELKEVLEVAMDEGSPYRIDAFNCLRKKFPNEGTGELLKLALDPTENEFFRCEAVRLIGSLECAEFAESLVRIFAIPPTTDVRNGAGARGCAIEYLAHRGRRDLVLGCIVDCDLSWRTPNEKCKIMWSVNEVLKDAVDTHLQGYIDAVEQLCDACRTEANTRVLHWRDQVDTQLQRISRCVQKIDQAGFAAIPGDTPMVGEVNPYRRHIGDTQAFTARQ